MGTWYKINPNPNHCKERNLLGNRLPFSRKTLPKESLSDLTTRNLIGPSRTRNTTESIFSIGTKFATMRAKRYRECSETFCFSWGKRQENGTDNEKYYDSSKILQIPLERFTSRVQKRPSWKRSTPGNAGSQNLSGLRWPGDSQREVCWVYANGGIINGGVACVCAKWRVFVHFARFCAFLCVSVRFFLPKWPAEKREFAHNRAKMCKKRFYAIPPWVIPAFACHWVWGVIHANWFAENTLS